ncbi:MAG: YheU family protein [Deltaproteobacteria bacterium]|nr:MAG: YheU family protein [Deltaproteobacteria bacterium]
MRTAWEVPHKHLTPEALHSLAEEFVTRDGTDYGQVEKTLEEKVAALMRQLERGEAAILYDSESQTINIAPRHALR